MVSVKVLVFLCTAAVIPPGSGIQTSLTQSDRVTGMYCVAFHYIRFLIHVIKLSTCKALITCK